MVLLLVNTGDTRNHKFNIFFYFPLQSKKKQAMKRTCACCRGNAVLWANEKCLETAMLKVAQEWCNFRI